MATDLQDVETTDEILIENVGPIEQLHIPLPKGGGVVVLTGDNGSGKSESLGAIRALAGSATDKKDLRPRDGEKSGLVEGCGVTIKVGRANRETGDLTVSSLEDKLDIKQLVDPEILDLNAADARRLKSLIRVSGVKADLSLFEPLLGNTFEIDAKILKEPDLVTMAAGIKRTLEAKARSEETAAEASGIEAATCLKSVEGIDIEAESDEAALQAAYRAAAARDAELRQQAATATNAKLNQQQARKTLEQAKAEYTGVSLDDADVAHTAAVENHDDQYEIVADLRQKLSEAQEELTLRKERLSAATDALKAAHNHAKTIGAWEQQLTEALPMAPSFDECQAAADAMDRATRAMQNGTVVRNAKAKHAEAGEWTKKKRAKQKQAEHWREAAKGVDAVLSEVVANLGCPIKVGEDDKGLRLTIKHPRRGETFFSELSMGEKVRIVLPIAVNAVGPGGMFVAPQEFWEGLQPSVQREISSLLKNTGVWMLTAQCSDGPLAAKLGAI